MPSPIERLISKRTHDLGGGFLVGRVLPFHAHRMVGPFLFFDHLGPLDLAPGIPRTLDVRPHPHIGLSTVTYLYSGRITHRDSLGYVQEILPGEVNWMVAGRGITHSERLDNARLNGAHMHGIQTWVALPDAQEECPPAFYHHRADTLPAWQEGGVHGRLIAGCMDGLTSPVRTYSPMFYQHLTMAAGARHSVAPTYPERALYCATGALEVAGTRLTPGQMAVLAAGQPVDIRATEAAEIMLLGGEPVGERFLLWNFVSSSKERLRQAADDWLQQRMPLPPDDNQEFTPLPEKYRPTAGATAALPPEHGDRAPQPGPKD